MGERNASRDNSRCCSNAHIALLGHASVHYHLGCVVDALHQEKMSIGFLTVSIFHFSKCVRQISCVAWVYAQIDISFFCAHVGFAGKRMGRTKLLHALLTMLAVVGSSTFAVSLSQMVGTGFWTVM